MSDGLAELDIVVQVSDREDGGLRVRSPDIPGMFLGGADHVRTWGAVGAVVEHALRHERGLDVRQVIGPMTPPDVRGDVVIRCAPCAAGRPAPPRCSSRSYAKRRGRVWERAGWRYAETLNDTTEVWLKIGRRPVYLTPEADGTGCYEEEMIKAVEDLG